MVQVTLPNSGISRCVYLEVTGESGGMATSMDVAIAPGQRVAIPVSQSDFGAWAKAVAVGENAGCTTATGERAEGRIEWGQPLVLALVFGDGGVVVRPDAGQDGGFDAGPEVDIDRDGFIAGPDCNDADPSVHPNAIEFCDDAIDNDCDQHTDCTDTACARSPACQPPESDCSDGIDNDLDTLVDCLDPHCDQKVCNDGFTCTSGEVCVGLTCFTNNRCTATNGLTCGISCLVGTSCQPRTANVGTACNDGNICTNTDLCAADGSCEGTQLICPAHTDRDPACYFGAGCRNPSPVCVHQFADAGAPCGQSSACLATGCDANGRCARTPRAFRMPCDGGACGSDAGCTERGFRYAPAHVNDEQVPVWVDAGFITDLVACGAVIAATPGVNSQAVATGPCVAGSVTLPSLPINVGAASLVIGIDGDLDLSSGVLSFTGNRPIILLVRGNVTFRGGALEVGSIMGRSGAGARACASGAGLGGAGPFAPGAGGGGFGTVGGQGSSSGGAANPGGVGGPANGAATLATLQGGCPGGVTGVGATHASGGGALQLSVSGRLVLVSGGVSANGQGGPAGDAGFGGLGGGSGGAILLEAAEVSFEGGWVTANGGGGGSGTTAAGVGAPGQDGLRLVEPALGGAVADCALGGGAGAYKDAGAGSGGLSLPQGCLGGPGGGGGGGAGRIRINAGACVGSATLVSPTSSSDQVSCIR